MKKSNAQYEAAKRVSKLFDRAIKEETILAREGSRKSAVEFIRLITAKNVALVALGYYSTDANRLVRKGSKAYKIERERLQKLLTKLTPPGYSVG